jgi:outer membrane protein assembly factor BamC
MRKVLLTAALAVLSACASDSVVDYKSAGTLPPLEVPPDLTSPARDNRYAVPDTGRSSATLSGYQAERREPARATALTAVLPENDRMTIERSGSQRWLVVQEPPEKLWPLVKEFWQAGGFLIKLELPEAGVMETDWAESRAKIPQGFVRELIGKVLEQISSTSERDKFRTRLERAPDGKGTEIYISHRGMAEVYMNERTVDQTVWQPRAPDPGLESEFLRRLMVRLGAQEARAKELTAPGAQPAQRAEIRNAGDGTQLLQVNEPFDRAWRRVGLALDRVGFTVEDRDRQNGLYFVRYADPEADMERKNNEKSLLSKLFDFTSKDSKVKPEQYRVQVREEQDRSQVNVLNKDGAAESSKTSQRILTLLHEQLK